MDTAQEAGNDAGEEDQRKDDDENAEEGTSVELKTGFESSPAMPVPEPRPRDTQHPENANAAVGTPPPTMGHWYQVDKKMPRRIFVHQV